MFHSWVKKKAGPKVCKAGAALIAKEIIMPIRAINTDTATTITGLLKGSSGLIVAAVDGTDYLNSSSAANLFPTLNQNTTGTAARLTTPRTINGVPFDGSANINIGTLATPRAIYGNDFDGSAALTQIIASTYGGTGNGFTKFTGPTTSEKTFTLPNASATILTSNSVIVKIDIFLMILFYVSKKVDYFLCKYLLFSFLNK